MIDEPVVVLVKRGFNAHSLAAGQCINYLM